jgi:hypothetical protein
VLGLRGKERTTVASGRGLGSGLRLGGGSSDAGHDRAALPTGGHLRYHAPRSSPPAPPPPPRAVSGGPLR